MRGWIAASTAVLLFSLGCGTGSDSSDDPDTPAVEDTPQPGDDGVAQVDDDTPPPPDLAALSPAFSVAQDNSQTAPRRLTIRFNRNVVDNDTVGTFDASSTAAVIQPPVPGEWEWTAPDRLTFEPTKGFAPGQKYELQLSTVGTKFGKLTGAPVLHTLEVPAFKLLSANVAVRHRSYSDIDVVFSGPVAPDDASRIKLVSRGKTVKHEVLNSGRKNRLRFRVRTKDLGEGQHTVRVETSGDVRSAVDATAKAPRQQVSVKVDTTVDQLQIRRATLKEGQDGYFVDIICHDGSVGPAEYWWDNENYDSYRVSDRCMLSNDSLSTLKFEPEVDIDYIAEGTRGFRIFGDFQQGPLKLTLESGSYTADGGVLDKPFVTDFDVPMRTPRVELVAKQGRYVPKGSWTNLPIRHLNADKVEVAVYRVPPENLVFWLSSDDESATSRTADLVEKKRIAVQNPKDQVHSSWIDLASLIGDDTQGLFEIRVNPIVNEEVQQEEDPATVDTGWAPPSRNTSRVRGKGDTSRIVLTDLHLIAKSDEAARDGYWPRKITAFAFGAVDNEAVSGVIVDAVKPSGFVMGTCRTGWDGSCELVMPNSAEAVDTTAPIALVARKGDDTTYLKFSDLKAAIAEDDVAGEPWLASAYEASLYTDRGVYRPGDTVHFGMVLRGQDNHAPSPAVPMTLSILDPRRKLSKKVQLTGDENGLATWDLNLAAFAATGSYKARLEVGEDTVAEYGFSVEEFVPERMKVTAEIRGQGHLASEAGTVDIEARYLFGGSAEGSRAQVSCSLAPGRFRPRKNKQLHYGPVFVGSEKRPGSILLADPETTLDAEGQGTVSCPGNSAGFVGTATLTADVAVFEAGSGRSTRSSATVPVHPETFYIGLESTADKAGPSKDVEVRGRVVDWEGEGMAPPSELEVVVYRLEEEYGWWRWDSRGEESYDLYLRRVEEDRTRISAGSDGAFSYSFRPRAHGAGYLVRVTAGNARSDLRLEGERRRYWWSHGETHVDRTPRPAKPTSLVVSVPKEVAVGARNEARVDVPFAGKVLMTLETDELLAYEWVDAKQAGPLTWPFTVEAFAPNVYVSAFLVKDPKLDSPQGYTPERGFGVASARVEADAFTLPVQLGVPSEVRSNSTLEVQVDLGRAGANASVTVAAVDEGILSLTKFQTPNPIADVLPHRRLGVTTYETVGWAMLMPAGPSAKTGGDGMGAGGRVQPVKPVALWSGKLTAGADGKATVTLNVPQYRGSLRVMAVAASKERVGSSEANVLVRDPLVLQTTLPRFLTKDDSFQIPVFVTNMSGKDQEIEVSLTAENLPWPGMPDDPNAPSPIAFLGERKATISVPKDKSKTVAFQAKALAQVGAATFRVKVQAGNLVSFEELDVPFAPNGPRARTTELVTLAKGNIDLSEHLQGWVPTTERTQLWVTGNPYGQAMGHLKHLVRYPYGCIEQTTSSTRPLLFVGNLVPAIMPELHSGELEAMVMSGVDRVLSMQTPSGGFGYWPGATRPTDWGTAYATHMLLDAKELQYDIPQDRIDDALDYLQSISKRAGSSSGFDTYRYSAPYAHYVLARGGRGNKAAIESLLGKIGTPKTGEDQEVVYLLKAALYLAGDRRYEKDLRNPDVSKLTGERQNNWRFYSDLRRRGMVLSTYQDLFGADDASGEALAKLVARGLEGTSNRYSTQELVWGITGLGKRVAHNSSSSKVKLTIDGKKVEPNKGKSGSFKDPVWSVVRASERSLSLQVDDAGKGRLFLIVNSEGIKQNALLKTGGQGLAIERRYLDSSGNNVDLANVELGDVVYTQVTVTNRSGDRIQNIALVDRFGAGFEIENPRLNRGGVIDWLDRDEQWDADHMNVRDDRLELFGALEAGESRQVVIGLRAVTAGEFTTPPVEAEAMYDPELWARKAGTKVTIHGPWKDVLL